LQAPESKLGLARARWRSPGTEPAARLALRGWLLAERATAMPPELADEPGSS